MRTACSKRSTPCLAAFVCPVAINRGADLLAELREEAAQASAEYLRVP
jgi:hypothetical protein